MNNLEYYVEYYATNITIIKVLRNCSGSGTELAQDTYQVKLCN